MCRHVKDVQVCFDEEPTLLAYIVQCSMFYASSIPFLFNLTLSLSFVVSSSLSYSHRSQGSPQSGTLMMTASFYELRSKLVAGCLV